MLNLGATETPRAEPDPTLSLQVEATNYIKDLLVSGNRIWS